MLNPRQLKFVKLYHLSGNASEAYSEAYGVKKPDVAKANGCRLLTNAYVRAELEKLAKEAEKVFEVKRADMLQLFHEIATSPVEAARDRISAAKEVCRMEGFYGAEKVEVSAEASAVDLIRSLVGLKNKDEKDT
jgi:phage terminase small subunit